MADTGSGRPPPPQVIFENFSFEGQHSISGSISTSHSIANGSRRLLLASLSFGESAWEPTPLAAFAGQPMTLLVRRESANTSQAIWYLQDPPIGTGTLSLNGLATSGDGLVLGAISLSGVNPMNPIGSYAAATGTGTTPERTVSSALGEIVVDFISVYGGSALVPAGGQTLHWSFDPGPPAPLKGRMAGSSRMSGSATTSVSWTATDGINWVIIAVPVKP